MLLPADAAIHIAFEDHIEYDPAAPERNLMRAILRTAMDDIKKSGEHYREARVYLMSDDESYLYSFLSVCAHLGLCPSSIRRKCGVVPGLRRELIAA